MTNLKNKLVRRKTVSGIVVGPYMIVQSDKSFKLCVINTSNDKFDNIPKNKVVKIDYLSCPIQRKLYDKLVKRKQTIFTHPLTTSYKRLLDEEKKFDVIKLYNRDGNCAFFKLEMVLHTRDLMTNKNNVRIYLGSLIFSV